MRRVYELPDGSVGRLLVDPDRQRLVPTSSQAVRWCVGGVDSEQYAVRARVPRSSGAAQAGLGRYSSPPFMIDSPPSQSDPRTRHADLGHGDRGRRGDQMPVNNRLAGLVTQQETKITKGRG